MLQTNCKTTQKTKLVRTCLVDDRHDDLDVDMQITVQLVPYEYTTYLKAIYIYSQDKHKYDWLLDKDSSTPRTRDGHSFVWLIWDKTYQNVLSGYKLVYFFFFSSRRRHTRCSRDWSSDVCSSD